MQQKRMLVQGRVSLWRFVGILMLALLVLPHAAAAQQTPPWRAAEQIQQALFGAQTALLTDADPLAKIADAEQRWQTSVAPPLRAVAPDAAAQVDQALADARAAVEHKDAAALALARGNAWAALLGGTYQATLQAVTKNHPDQAQQWLLLREYRTATRFSRPDADATLALAAWRDGTRSSDDARAAVVADLLDTYQARLNEALATVDGTSEQGFAVRGAETAGLAQGYWRILAPTYAEQRGADAKGQIDATFAALVAAVQRNDDVARTTAQQGIGEALRDFRAAPLTAQEQARRAGQLLRFLALVPVEYGRGVRNGQVTRDLEIQEAATFRDGAAAAFADIRAALEARDAAKTQQIDAVLGQLDATVRDTQRHEQVAEPSTIEADVATATTLLSELLPSEWQQHDAAGDFDVVASVLDNVEQAAAAGQYELAESARLEAYAVLETGPEARLIAFAPQMIAPLEDLFWYGQGEHKGLAQLIADHAPATQIKASRVALDEQLKVAEQALGGSSTAPAAVATNAAIIVFREGLEAVLILASLMGSMKLGEQRRFRRPIWIGAASAFGASVLTWILMRGVLQQFARYGERLEAIVSLIAIGVLLLITNWFFHKVYWTGWMANFHGQKKRILGGAAGLSLGLITLGFTSIYREGFETVLFLQALVLEAGTPTVLGGTAVGLAGTLLIGVLVFALQAKLPHKKMLIVTGVMIGAVLLVIVGNTVHVLQVVGWLPIHPIRSLQIPYWLSLWFGVFATWEGIALQFAAGAFVIGSYFLAERVQHRQRKPASGRPTARTVEGGGNANMHV